MSLPGNDLLENGIENASMSKREKKKFEQLLRQINASEVYPILYHRIQIPRVTRNAEIPPKENPILKPESLSRQFDPLLRRKVKSKNPKIKRAPPLFEKSQRKTQNPNKKLSKDSQKTYTTSTTKNTESVNVTLQKYLESEGFSDYMVNYTYGEKSKFVEKQYEDWEILANLGGAKIEIKTSLKDEQKTKSINEKLGGENEKGRELFSKASKEVIRKVMEELNAKKSK